VSEAVDYFSNHRHKLRFPWSLYHQPIVAVLASSLRRAPGRDVLNLGSGPFFEGERLDLRDRRVTLCDIEPRAIELARELHGERIARYDVVEPGARLPYADASFDLVVSMDVVEHLPDPVPWLREALRVLRPQGTLMLTTPNYASCTLGLIEDTILELVARRQGFSRKALHPSKMTPERLKQALHAAGAVRTQVRDLSLGWVLVSESSKG
jgi:SAM-dependent methyltransferase